MSLTQTSGSSVLEPKQVLDSLVRSAMTEKEDLFRCCLYLSADNELGNDFWRTYEQANKVLRAKVREIAEWLPERLRLDNISEVVANSHLTFGYDTHGHAGQSVLRLSEAYPYFKQGLVTLKKHGVSAYLAEPTHAGFEHELSARLLPREAFFEIIIAHELGHLSERELMTAEDRTTEFLSYYCQALRSKGLEKRFPEYAQVIRGIIPRLGDDDRASYHEACAEAVLLAMHRPDALDRVFRMIYQDPLYVGRR